MKMGHAMEDNVWMRLWEGLLKILPAFGGGFLSLRYLPESERDFLGIITALISGVLLGYFGGHWVIGFYDIPVDKWEANGIMLVVGTIGTIILDKIVLAIREISGADLKGYIKEAIRKWVT
jgi:hypothetical protein